MRATAVMLRISSRIWRNVSAEFILRAHIGYVAVGVLATFITAFSGGYCPRPRHRRSLFHDHMDSFLRADFGRHR